MVKKKSVPTGVKIISVLFYIVAVFYFIVGLFSFIGAGLVASIIKQMPAIGLFGIMIGVPIIGFGILDFFIARGLWGGRNWARILVIVLSILALVSLFVPFIGGLTTGGLTITEKILGLLVTLLIIGYLLFSKSVKEAFK